MPSAITVTATAGSTSQNGIRLAVKVLTGVAVVQNGPTATQSAIFSSPAAHRATLTTTVTGSLVYGAVLSEGSSAVTAQSGTTVSQYNDATNGATYADCRTTAATGTPGSVTVGASAPSTGGGCAIAEILPDGTLAEDPSAPAAVTDEGATTVTTAEFTPPGGALMVAMVAAGGSGGSTETMTVSGGGLTWTPLAEAHVVSADYAGVWVAVAAYPAGDDPPVTVTEGGSTSPGMVARIKVLTGAALSAQQTGAAVTQSGSAAHQASITTTQAGSIVYGGLADGTTTVMTAASGTTLLDNFQDTTQGNYYGTCRTTAATGTPGAVTVGASAPSSVGGAALAEILPVTPGGTITEDAVSPSATTTSTITVVVNVTPPAGALLVLMIGCDGGSGVETMTVSGGGLAWRALAEAHASGQMYAGVWIADYIVPAIAHDTATAGVNYTSTGTQTTSHPAAAGARAAVVLIDQNGTTADEVSGVTYGGAAMTRIRSDTEATEAGRTYVYFLDGIAGGTQNVAMTTTAATSKQLVAATMITDAGRAVAVAGHNTGTSASASNPSWSITGLTAGTRLAAYEVIHSGLTTMTTTPATSWTLITSTDLGAAGRGFARQEVASSGTTLTCGWTAATADDFVGSSVAFYALPGPSRPKQRRPPALALKITPARASYPG